MAFTEYQLIQNNYLGAHALWMFVMTYQTTSREKSGVPLALIYPILPIALSAPAAAIIKNRSYDKAGLSRVLLEDPSTFRGLQERMEAHFEQTSKALLIAYASRLLSIDKENCKIYHNNFPKTRYLKSPSKFTEDYYKAINCSKKLGSWFSQMNYEEILYTLKITF